MLILCLRAEDTSLTQTSNEYEVNIRLKGASNPRSSCKISFVAGARTQASRVTAESKRIKHVSKALINSTTQLSI